MSKGTSRLPKQNIYKRGNEIIESVIDYIGNNKFFFGDKISTLDLTIYGHISSIYQLPIQWKCDDGLPCKKEVNDYIKRVETECFGKVEYWKDIV